LVENWPEVGAHHAALAHALDVESRIAESDDCTDVANSLRKEAITEYQEAIRLKHNGSTTLIMLATVLEEDGQVEAAICAYHDVFKIRPDHVGAHLRLSKLLTKLNYEEEGRQELERATEFQREFLEMEPSARGWTKLGQMLGDLGQVEEAREAWQRASQQPIPKKPKGWSPTPGHYEFRLKEHDCYVRLAQEMLAISPENQSAA
jgi:tetratricopeptide (TPR) repeat protein